MKETSQQSGRPESKKTSKNSWIPSSKETRKLGKLARNEVSELASNGVTK